MDPTIETRSIDDTSGHLHFDIPMVSSDGQPHQLLTMIAVSSGLFAAIVVLLILVSLIAGRRRGQQQQPPATAAMLAKQQRSKSLFSVFGKRASMDITIVDANYLERTGAITSTAASSAVAATAAATERFRVMDERQRPDLGQMRESMPCIDEALFAADGKLHGITTVSC